MKKLRKLYFIGLFGLLFWPLFSVSAAEDSRYFVKSNSQFWKKTFSARHEFKDGFTANLNDWQIRFAKILGVNIETVGILQILPEELAEEVKAPIINGKIRPMPIDQVSWGLKRVYGVYGSSDPVNITGGEGVTVAVVDTGIMVNHPDLKSRVAKCKDFTNARFSVVNGKCEDKNGHGTHVAGIIAADGGTDGLGIYGVAPSAVLYAFKACSPNGACYADDVAAAIELAVDEGANIVNLSLGSDRSSVLISGALDYAFKKKVLVVAAAGNDGPYLESIDYPAAEPRVLAVGAFNSLLEVANWSSRGINEQTALFLTEEKDMELAAPGVNIESTWNNGGYAVLSGTSMASPFVAGLAAKLWPNFLLELDHSQAVKDSLRQMAMDIDKMGEDNASGFGFSRLLP